MKLLKKYIIKLSTLKFKQLYVNSMQIYVNVHVTVHKL